MFWFDPVRQLIFGPGYWHIQWWPSMPVWWDPNDSKPNSTEE